ncbi:MAG: C40 family peptidase [Candidatus Accumulibacter sp.]|jgi:cell wall-associated NlpC family hydrolase|nr:C40 family peptidase [Accumulibacter sp.]
MIYGKYLIMFFFSLACVFGGVSRIAAEEIPEVPDELALLLERYTDKSGELIRASIKHVNTDYRYGGASPEEGFDCSGFVQWVFKEAVGKELPRTAKAQSKFGRAVRRNELEPGDLIFFNTLRRAFSHVGIYVGKGHFIHSPRTGAKIRVDDMRGKYWSQRFSGARRVVENTLPRS